MADCEKARRSHRSFLARELLKDAIKGRKGQLTMGTLLGRTFAVYVGRGTRRLGNDYDGRRGGLIGFCTGGLSARHQQTARSKKGKCNSSYSITGGGGIEGKEGKGKSLGMPASRIWTRFGKKLFGIKKKSIGKHGRIARGIAEKRSHYQGSSNHRT